MADYTDKDRLMIKSYMETLEEGQLSDIADNMTQAYSPDFRNIAGQVLARKRFAAEREDKMTRIMEIIESYTDREGWCDRAAAHDIVAFLGDE